MGWYSLFTITLCTAFFLVCLSAVPVVAGSDRVTPAELKAMLEGGEQVLLIDVRTAGEHNEARIPSSVLMPLHTLEGVDRLPEGGTIILYCRSGKRSRTALDILSRKGYTGLRDLDGGINAWMKSGGGVISGK